MAIKDPSTLNGNLKVLGYSQYNISEYGIVTNVRTGSVLKPFIDRRGYENYSLWGDDGTRKTLRGHQLVARLYIPNPNHFSTVDHLDTNKRNNHVSNLEWVSNEENCKRAREAGLSVSVVTEEQVHEICRSLECNESQMSISRRMNVPYTTISSIKLRRNWKSISKHYNF